MPDEIEDAAEHRENSDEHSGPDGQSDGSGRRGVAARLLLLLDSLEPFLGYAGAVDVRQWNT
ncbi:hypothetical protein [Streptomyces sp. NPDC017958]|uniref:hypothetical protein n=1 Tax=Streptomyces sp. NPDC017958 TaxID=3365021 RepID=UPI0037B02102